MTTEYFPILPVSNNREAWLNRAVQELKPFFQEKGYVLPAIRISCGFASTGSTKHIGQCFPTTMSDAGENELFISPVLDDPIEVLATLVHEVVHAIDDCKNSHGKAFKKIALEVGLAGKMRSTHAGDDLKARLTSMFSALRFSAVSDSFQEPWHKGFRLLHHGL
jgi:hypothetical protein